VKQTSKRTEPFENPRAFGVYIHFPYCERICSYCDFVVTASSDIPHKNYANAVLREFEDRGPRFDDMDLVSIYFGGGTPSLWSPDQIAKIINRITDRYGREHIREITLEANPSPQLQGRLDALAKAGITRISLGIQSLDDATLQTLCRTHTASQALSDLERILVHPAFQKTSGDLIYGLPNSTVASVTQDAERICDLGISHLSMYALTLEEGTPLKRSVTRETISIPDDDHVADQAEAIWTVAQNSGLTLYEVSSAAVPGHEAIHNSLYWHQRGYLGLGVGAHGLEPAFSSASNAYARWVYRENTKKLPQYLAEPEGSAKETPHNRISWLQDLLIVRPRWLQGFLVDEIYAHTTSSEREKVMSELTRLENEDLLTLNGSHLRLTHRGLLFADSVTERLVSQIGHQATI